MRSLVIVVLGVAAACCAQAQTYKWIDENGRVQYTQTPPPPGRQAQQIKPPATQSAPRPDPAGKGAGAPPPDAAQQPGARGKAAGRSRDKEASTPPDALRMLGEWRTHPGTRVQIRFRLQQGPGAGLTTAQSWSVGENSHATTGMKIVVSGTKGAGSLEQDTAEKLPSMLRYELKGDGLILTVDSGPFAGTHLLTRNQ